MKWAQKFQCTILKTASLFKFQDTLHSIKKTPTLKMDIFKKNGFARSKWIYEVTKINYIKPHLQEHTYVEVGIKV